MSAVRPSEETVPKPRSSRQEAWALRIRSSQLLLRCIETIGHVLGHIPGSVTSDDNVPVFTYTSIHTLYASLIIAVITFFKVYSMTYPADTLGAFDTKSNVAEVAPFYLEIVFFYLIVAFTFCRSLPIKLAILDVYDMAKHTPAPSCTKQFFAVFVWCLFICMTIARYVTIALYTMSVPCAKFSFSTVATPLQEIFTKIYMTWLLQVFILISINLRERQQLLRTIMKEAITPPSEASWDFLDMQVIEGVIEQHRLFSRLLGRFYKAMSPALLVLVTSFFINEAFGLYTFLTNVVFIGGILEPIALIDGGFLFSHFLLIFSVCSVTSSLSDQWCGVGQEVTGVPLCRVTEQIRIQLLTFLQQLPDLAPVITAAGFFFISKSLLITMMNFIATYLIFMVQFYDIQKPNITYDQFDYCNISATYALPTNSTALI